MATVSNMTHRVSREDDGLKLTCEAFSKGMHFSKSQTDTLVVYCEFESFLCKGRFYLVSSYLKKTPLRSDRPVITTLNE